MIEAIWLPVSNWYSPFGWRTAQPRRSASGSVAIRTSASISLPNLMERTNASGNSGLGCSKPGKSPFGCASVGSIVKLVKPAWRNARSPSIRPVPHNGVKTNFMSLPYSFAKSGLTVTLFASAKYAASTSSPIIVSVPLSNNSCSSANLMSKISVIFRI